MDASGFAPHCSVIVVCLVDYPSEDCMTRAAPGFDSLSAEVMTRSALLEHIWDAAGDFVNDNTLTVYIKRLRDKLEDDPQSPALIQTVRNLGYKLSEDE